MKQQYNDCDNILRNNSKHIQQSKQFPQNKTQHISQKNDKRFPHPRFPYVDIIYVCKMKIANITEWRKLSNYIFLMKLVQTISYRYTIEGGELCKGDKHPRAKSNLFLVRHTLHPAGPRKLLYPYYTKAIFWSYSWSVGQDEGPLLARLSITQFQ